MTPGTLEKNHIENEVSSGTGELSVLHGTSIKNEVLTELKLNTLMYNLYVNELIKNPDANISKELLQLLFKDILL